MVFQRLFFIQTPLQKQKITENRKHTHPVFPSRESSGVCPKAIPWHPVARGKAPASGQEMFVLGCLRGKAPPLAQVRITSCKMTSCSRLGRRHSLRLQLLAPHNTKRFPSAKLFSASTLTTRCVFRTENGIRMDHIHVSFFKINMSVKTKHFTLLLAPHD